MLSDSLKAQPVDSNPRDRFYYCQSSSFFFGWNFCACETNVVAAVGHQFETTAIYYSQQTLEW